MANIFGSHGLTDSLLDAVRDVQSKSDGVSKHAAFGYVTEKKKMDPVGGADADIDNDGDVDSSDKFLHKKRKAISKAMNKEEVQEETLAMKAAKHIAYMWEDSAKAKEAKVKEEEEETPKKKESKTAMTGKPMAGVEVNPKESKDK